jgi:hypothetical protein
VNKVIKVLFVLLGGVFIILQGGGFEVEGAAISALLLLLLSLFYSRTTERKSKFFFWFLATFTLAHAFNCLAYYLPYLQDGEVDYPYYGTNILYILSYIFLIIKILKDLDLRHVFSELSVSILILLVLDVFCVIMVTATAEDVLSFYQYSLELVYNGVIMALLSVALINYMYRNDNKSMYFLVASMCIVFSEIIQLAYFYILDESSLGYIYSFLLVVAFSFFYLQSQKEFSGPEPSYLDDQYEL